MPKYIEPAIDLHAFNCPHLNCGALADQTWYRCHANPLPQKGHPEIISQEFLEKIEQDILNAKDEKARRISKKMRNRVEQSLLGFPFLHRLQDSIYCDFSIDSMFLSRCFSCNNISIWKGDKLLFPTVSIDLIPNEDLDPDIQKDFLEAAQIVVISPRGAAALLRLCIQKLCKQIGEKGKNIDDDIASLVKNGLDVRLQKALDIVRVTGNDSVHPGQMDIEDNPKTAASLFGLVNTIADNLISQPKHIDSLFEALPDSKKQAIEKRDTKNPKHS